MAPVHLLYIVSSVVAAISAFVASIYWYLSSRPAPQFADPPTASISDNPSLFILSAQVDVYRLQAAMSESSSLNKKAALWSATSAICGGITFVIPLLGH